MPDDSIRPLIAARSFSPSPTTTFEVRDTMDHHSDLAGGSSRKRGSPWVVTLSYVFDWVALAAFAAIGYVLGDIEPTKRPFSLDDRNIAYVSTPSRTCDPQSSWRTNSSPASRTPSTRRSPSGLRH